MVRVKSASGGEYILIASDESIGLYDTGSRTWVGSIDW